MRRKFQFTLLISMLALLGLSGCSSTRNVELEANFPVPLVSKVPIAMGVHLTPEIREYVYTEKIGKSNEWNVAVGPVQQTLFANLAQGMFDNFQVIAADTAELAPQAAMDAVLKPSIEQLQFALPDQTRTNYYEVWIRYNFQLYDPAGELISEWPLPAYGKAHKKDFGNKQRGVEAAALAACRDAMAFFSINFASEPAIEQWLQSMRTP